MNRRTFIAALPAVALAGSALAERAQITKATPVTRPPLPPFTRETAIEKVRLAEDGWNSRDAAKVALAYTVDTRWRNRVEFATNRQEAQAFLRASGRKNTSIGSSRSYGHSRTTGLPCAMLTNIATTAGSGFAPMATKTGSLLQTA